MTARDGTPSRGFRLRRMVGAAKATRRGLSGDGPTPIYDQLAAETTDPLGSCVDCEQEPIHGGARCLVHVEPVVGPVAFDVSYDASREVVA